MKPDIGKIAITCVLLAGCTYKEIPVPTPVVVDCTASTFVLNPAAKANATDCLLIDGSFTIGATGGVSPYVFSLNGGDFQANSTFSNLAPGYYWVTGRDANLCERSIQVEISASGSDLAATVNKVGDTDCLGGNGTINITPSGGDGPYTFQFGTGAPSATSSFAGLNAGYYSITLRDDNHCIKVINVQVTRDDTGTSLSADIQPILNTYCAISGCHTDNGVGVGKNWNVVEDIRAYAPKIKQRTGDRSMPLTGGPLTQDEIDLIACWVDDGAKNN